MVNKLSALTEICFAGDAKQRLFTQPAAEIGRAYLKHATRFVTATLPRFIQHNKWGIASTFIDTYLGASKIAQLIADGMEGTGFGTSLTLKQKALNRASLHCVVLLIGNALAVRLTKFSFGKKAYILIIGIAAYIFNASKTPPSLPALSVTPANNELSPAALPRAGSEAELNKPVNSYDREESLKQRIKTQQKTIEQLRTQVKRVSDKSSAKEHAKVQSLQEANRALRANLKAAASQHESSEKSLKVQIAALNKANVSLDTDNRRLHKQNLTLQDRVHLQRQDLQHLSGIMIAERKAAESKISALEADNRSLEGRILQQNRESEKITRLMLTERQLSSEQTELWRQSYYELRNRFDQFAADMKANTELILTKPLQEPVLKDSFENDEIDSLQNASLSSDALNCLDDPLETLSAEAPKQVQATRFIKEKLAEVQAQMQHVLRMAEKFAEDSDDDIEFDPLHEAVTCLEAAKDVLQDSLNISEGTEIEDSFVQNSFGFYPGQVFPFADFSTPKSAPLYSTQPDYKRILPGPGVAEPEDDYQTEIIPRRIDFSEKNDALSPCKGETQHPVVKPDEVHLSQKKAKRTYPNGSPTKTIRTDASGSPTKIRK